MKNLFNHIQFIVLTAILAVIGGGLLYLYNIKIRNDSLDGCAMQSFYQNESTDTEGRQVTVREPQRSLYQDCLKAKGLIK